MSNLPSALFESAPMQANSNAKLTVLSHGNGQDSTALLYRYVYDPGFKARFAPNDFIVVYCDTGNEFPETYEHNEKITAFCKEHGIEYYVLRPEMGYHYDGWHSLQNHFDTYNSIMGTGLLRTCTDKLKIQPFHNFLEEYISKRYNLPSGRKRAHKLFAQINGPVNVLLGIAHGEEKRMRTAPFAEAWKQQSIRHVYPLMEMKMDRLDCQDYIYSVGHDVPVPSNCVMCPFCSHQELIYVYRFQFKQFLQWVEFERRKIERDTERGVERPMGVKGKWIRKEDRAYTLVDALEEALEKFGHLSDDALKEYRFSHGHCVQSVL
ncbi:phosphoadenosine phosphosulfate reductase domain-containing protein [Thiomicrolovo sp. ZZH C-3]